MYPKKNQSTTVAGYKLFYFSPSSTGYEYFNFQFLKLGGYAQRLCMQNFQIWLLKKLQANLAKQKQHKQNPKQSNLQGIVVLHMKNYERLYPIVRQVSCRNHAPTKTNHKINHCQLAIVQRSQLLQASHNSTLPKNVPLLSIPSNLHLVYNCGVGH